MTTAAGMRPDDVTRLGAATDPRLSPDGRLVAYVRSWVDADDRTPRSAIEVVSVDGAAPARRLTSGAHRDAEPRWSPDGRWLAFTSVRDGSPAQLFVLPADGPGEARRLTARDEAVAHIAWSPDATRLAFVSRVRDPAYDETDDTRREPRRIRRLLYKLDHEGWTIDRPRHLWTVGLDGADPVLRTDGDAEDDWPAWSPDGTIIACLFTPGVLDEPHNGRVATVDAATGARTILTEGLDRTCAPYPPMRPPAWDGDRVVFAYEDRGAVVVASVPAAGGEATDLVRGDGCVAGFDVADGTVVHAWTDPTHAPEIVAGGRMLTDAGADLRSAAAPIAPVAFTAVAPDGAEVDAWAILPPGDEDARVPLLLHVHGGPFTQYGARLFDEFQVTAGAGYGVVYANPRGSSGREEAWGRAIRGPVGEGRGWGSVDAEDLLAVVDAALARFPRLDPDRIAVMGGSYGGYMTSWLVGHSGRFACAISERAVNDMVSMEGASDIAGFFQAYVGASWWEARAAYEAMSPVSYVQEIRTPLLILHSEDDLRCPIGQGEQLFVALRRLERDVEMIRFPAEGHELTRSGSPTHRIRRFEIVLEFLARHLHP